jgi:heat shock protein HslJ
MRAPTTILSLTLGLLTLACGSTSDGGSHEPVPSAPPTAPVVASIVGAWDVTSIEGSPVVEGTPAYVEFTPEGRFVGNAGVNHLGATYELEGSVLSLSAIASTMMAGPQPLMEQEQRMTAALARVRSTTVEENTLVLHDGGGAELVRAQRR